jgi:oligopeptide/dipeptide ABC transporter ATP-binding protein
MVLYMGRVMEEASREQIYRQPRHPYTRALLSAAPIPDPAIERGRHRVRLSGEPPSPLDPASAFRFLPSRLPLDPAQPPSAPALQEVEPGHFVSEFDVA